MERNDEYHATMRVFKATGKPESQDKMIRYIEESISKSFGKIDGKVIIEWKIRPHPLCSGTIAVEAVAYEEKVDK